MDLSIRDLRVRLQDTEILHGVDLDIADGEFVALLGPSGCGKSTLIKSVAGLLDVSGGEICAGGHSLLGVPPERRGTVIVFQDLRLFPHMTVYENIAFSLTLKKRPREETVRTVESLLEEVQLPGYGKRRIRELSGGEMQRVALARALAAEPKLLLLDEPFTGLNEKLRFEMGRLVQALHRERGLTTVLITHDRQEALRLADRVALMQDGRILQHGTPEELFWHPLSRTVAEYFGKVNCLPGRAENGRFSCALGSWPCDLADGSWTAAIRPFDMRLVPGGEDYTVTGIDFLGETAELALTGPAGAVTCAVTAGALAELALSAGSRTGLTAGLGRAVYFREEPFKGEMRYHG